MPCRQTGPAFPIQFTGACTCAQQVGLMIGEHELRLAVTSLAPQSNTPKTEPLAQTAHGNTGPEKSCLHAESQG